MSDYDDDYENADDDDMFEEVCGETMDHELALIGQEDGWATFVCTVCGAEIFEDVVDDVEEEE